MDNTAYDAHLFTMVMEEVRQEVEQQRRIGEQDYQPIVWLSILGKAYGEACKESIKAALSLGTDYSKYRKGMIGVAAVAIRALECYSRQSERDYQRKFQENKKEECGSDICFCEKCGGTRVCIVHEKIYDLPIEQERERQNRLWGIQNHPPSVWLSILGEEYGESCQAANEAIFPGYATTGDFSNYSIELVQVSAVAIQAVECYERFGASEIVGDNNGKEK